MIQSVVVISVEEKDFAEIDVAAHIKLFSLPVMPVYHRCCQVA